MNNFLILLAAGSGSRMNLKTKKQFIKVNNKFLYEVSFNKFIKTKQFFHFVIVLPECDIKSHTAYLKKNYEKLFNDNKISIIIGGKERYDSVRNAILYIKNNFLIDEKTYVFMHDAARPFVDIGDIKKIIYAAHKYKSVSLASKIVDTIKEVKSNKDFEVKKTLDRNLLYSIKTPQGFLFNIIFSAYEKYDRHRIVTDDIEIVELYTKHKSYLVVSDKMNMKITNKSDLEYLKKLM